MIDLKEVGELEGSTIYQRGEWYFVRNKEGKWAKLLFDYGTGAHMKNVLDRQVGSEPVEKKEEDSPPPSEGGFTIDPL